MYFMFPSFYSYFPSEICRLPSLSLQTPIFGFHSISSMNARDNSSTSKWKSFSSDFSAGPTKCELTGELQCHCSSQDCGCHPLPLPMPHNSFHQHSYFCCCHFQFSNLFSSEFLNVSLAVSLSLFQVISQSTTGEKVLRVPHRLTLTFLHFCLKIKPWTTATIFQATSQRENWQLLKLRPLCFVLGTISAQTVSLVDLIHIRNTINTHFQKQSKTCLYIISDILCFSLHPPLFSYSFFPISQSAQFLSILIHNNHELFPSTSLCSV